MEKPLESKAKFHIEILSVLKDAQQQHGLRHKDYQSYHQYISRKLHRMRKSLNFQQGKGNRFTLKKLTKAMVTDSRFLLMKLFEAERAWAHAMQLKSEANTEPRKVYHMRSRLKKAVERANELWELCKWDRCDEHQSATGAECELCGHCDAHTYIEAQAYLYTMQAVRWFEVSEWRRAQTLYEKAHLEYSALAKAVDKDQQQLYLAKCDELRPLIRYCSNNAAAEGPGELPSSGNITSGDPELSALHVAGGDLDRFNDLLKQIYKNQVCAITEVQWLGIVIPVKRENVRLAILALNDSNRELSRSELSLDAKIAIYDSMLKTFNDALSSIRDDLKGSGPNNSAQITNMTLETMSRLQILFVYLHYVKLTKTVERNLLIMENSRDTVLTKPQNMARLYDTVMQNLQEMAGLPGLSGTTGNGHQDQSGGGEDAQHEIQARICAYTAFRCYYLSQAHLLMRRFHECQALLSRTLRHCESAIASLRSLHTCSDSVSEETTSAEKGGVALRHGALIPGPSISEMVDKLVALVDMVTADQLICRASRCLSLITDSNGSDLALGTGTGSNSACLDLPLAKRLDEFVEDPLLSRKPGQANSVTGAAASAVQGRLIEMCPEFEPIPVKPVFFDLAFYHVKFPSLDDKLAGKDRRGRAQGSASHDGSSAGKGGLTGLVKGWIWGGSK